MNANDLADAHAALSAGTDFIEATKLDANDLQRYLDELKQRSNGDESLLKHARLILEANPGAFTADEITAIALEKTHVESLERSRVSLMTRCTR